MIIDRVSPAPIIELKGVSRRFEKNLDLFGHALKSIGFPLKSETVHAVDNVNLAIRKGEVIGVVGESGCGKSTLGRMVAGILPPSSGIILRDGKTASQTSQTELTRTKLRTQMIFQDPFSSLNPRMRVSDIVGQAPQHHGIVPRDQAATYIDDQLRRAGIDPSMKNRYPHQFSGGQRQRIGIARALAVKPDFLVCDESVAALDVSIQAQILNLFMKLRSDLDLTYLFISHDLGVVEHISDRVVVMYLGRIVEQAAAEELFAKPNHPYTKSLLAAVPRIENRKRAFTTIKGELPSPLNPPPGCHFHQRCPFATNRCRAEVPKLRSIAPGHASACHLNDATS